MKKKIIYCLTAALALLANHQYAFGQGQLLPKLHPADSLSGKLKVIRGTALVSDTSLTVRNSFTTPADKSGPATASFSLPSGKVPSFLIDLGLEYKFDRLYANGEDIRGSNYGPFAVFDRNTQIGKQQYLYGGGLQSEWTWGKSTNDFNHMNYVNMTLQYLRNQADSSNSLVATFYYSYFSNNVAHPEDLYINNYHGIGGSPIFYNLTFNAGPEFQDIFQAAKKPTGLQARLYASPGFSLALREKAKNQKSPVKSLWPKLLELNIDYTARYAYANTVHNEARYLPLFKPSLNYYPLLNNKFSFGLSYNNGSDPIAGIAKQTYWQLAVQFQK